MFWALDLLTSFPDAYFVFVSRDPRDIVASLLRQWWGPSDVGSCIEYYRMRHHKWQQIRTEIHAQHLDSRLIEVRFEELVEKPVQTLDRIFDRFGLKPIRLSIDATRAHIGQWKTQFDDEQRRQLNEELHHELVECRYA